MNIIYIAYKDLDRPIDLLNIERFAVAIHQVMSARYRQYHNLQHVFNMVQGVDALGVLAVVFHDTVYVQVDRRVHPYLSPYLKEFAFNDKFEVTLPNLHSDFSLEICGKLFGFSEGMILDPFNGLNEFLSAVSAIRILEETLEPAQLIQIAACIEATIPFRPKSESGETQLGLLENRLKHLLKEQKISLSKDQIELALKRCVEIANLDIGGFHSRDFGFFLAQTWHLLLENNPIFKNSLYTIKQYGLALSKVELFLSSLRPENVVQQYKGYPIDKEFLRMRDQVKMNLTSAVEYLRVKMVSIAILEILAELSGGDAPYLMLIGEEVDLPQFTKAPIEEHIYITIRNALLDQGKNLVVHEILKFGRAFPSGFDFKHSPIASFIYEHMPMNKINDAITMTKGIYEKTIDRRDFLRFFPDTILNPIIEGVGMVAWSRKPQLLALQKSLQKLEES